MARPVERARTPTSERVANSKKHAFTLFEMILVCAVLVLMAALITPSLLARQRGEDERKFLQDIRNLVTRARLDAIRQRVPMRFEFDSSARSFRVVEEAAEQEGSAPSVAGAELPEGMTIGAARVGTADVGESGWALTFTPDGRSDGGGIELETGSFTRSLIVSRDGDARLEEGDLPPSTDETWAAGEYERRL